jgi:hypothetical protein
MHAELLSPIRWALALFFSDPSMSSVHIPGQELLEQAIFSFRIC